MPFDIQDPTDFLRHAETPGLYDLDNALRCNVCSELYNAPMSLNCGHAYCSLCIRSALQEKEECPGCFQPAKEVHLRKNIVLEEGVVAWKLAREFVLRLTKQFVQGLQDGTKTSGSSKKRKRTPEDSTSPPPKRGVPEDDDKQEGSSNIVHSSQSPPSSSILRTPAVIDVDMEVIPSSDAEEEEYLLRENELVTCPLCQQHVPQSTINEHIDKSCQILPDRSPKRTSKQKSKQEWTDLFSGPVKESKSSRTGGAAADPNKRLAAVSYSLFNDKKLRDLLQQLDLPTTGDKAAMIARHERYVLLHNANLDTDKRRKTPKELRDELRTWEQAQKVKKPVVKDVHKHQREHNDAFKAHIEAARKTKGKPNPSRTADDVKPPG